MILLTIVVSLFVIVYIVPWLWSRRHIYLLSWKLPGPFALPFIGNGMYFLKHEDNIEVADYLCRKYKTPLRVWMGTKLFVMLDNADDIETVLTSPHCLNKEDSYKYFAEAISTDGLFTSEASTWKRHRKLISPAFGKSSVYMYLPIFNKRLKVFVKMLGKAAETKKIFDIRLVATEVTMDMILTTTLGDNITENEKKMYSKYLTVVENIASKRIFQPWNQIEWIWKLTSYPKAIETFKQIHSKMFEKIIKSRSVYGAEKLLLVDKLIRVSEENKYFKYDNVVGECNTVMMAGSDTSAFAIASTLLMLALHPECQQKAYEEIKSTLPESLDQYELTREDIERNSYIERCMKEAIRIIPVVSMISRQNTETVQLRDYTIPAGTSIAININKIHKDPTHWGDDADKYNPDNFLPENISKMHPFSYIVFSGGPRNCVGYKYATIVVKMALIYILHNYRITTLLQFKDIKYYMNINTDLLCKHMIQLHKR